ncbi:ACT domain-containing protein [Motilibacter aurantiacus]|uniref:ACT domain-containing protein n=1 Tax=Motilibacter aurantiacus TaxID=2714955 RepID=UPI00140D6DA8|nr:ACT domain-containing protein [Motilibacter aurantiacus]NHC44201.1 ACT domain-containing protein [Motilibacter aurantiacus]
MSDQESSFTERRWVFLADSADQPGALTSITGVFSTRGVNFDSVATSTSTPGIGTVVGLFRASERRCQQLARTLRRLEAVQRVTLRPAEDPSVRAAAVVRMPESGTFTPSAATATTWTGDGSAERPLLVQGSLRAVERVVEEARRSGGTATLTVLAL